MRQQTENATPVVGDPSMKEGSPTSRDANLDPLARSATYHCMTGCLIGEVSGLAIATALGWGTVASISLAIGLAYLFGFALTSIPLFRAGLAFSTMVPIALATDFVSITIMEAIDNAVVLAVPGALHAGLLDWLMWTSMMGGFVIAFPFAFLANRSLLRRGKGHALVHAYHQHST
jgi:putative flippase GtrA